MTGQCPRCQVRLELPRAGRYRCERCRLQFDVHVSGAPPPAAQAVRSWQVGGPRLPWAPAALVPEPANALQGRCAAHPNNAATDVCERCGDFMCGVCRTAVEGRRYCPRCFDILFTRGSLLFTHRAFNLPAYSLTLGILSLVGCYCSLGLFSLPAGIIAIILGVNSLREIARRPDLPGRGRAIWGIVFGALGLLVSVGFVVAFIIMAARQ
jgi:hypothetical protein